MPPFVPGYVVSNLTPCPPLPTRRCSRLETPKQAGLILQDGTWIHSFADGTRLPKTFNHGFDTIESRLSHPLDTIQNPN